MTGDSKFWRVAGQRRFCETPIPKAKRIGIGKLMRPKFQKQSALKLAGRIIPQSGGYNTP